MTENPLGYEKIPELLKNFAIKLRNQKNAAQIHSM